MTIDFYYFLPSPFCRSVLLTARALGLSLNLKETNVWEGEQNKPEFVALNPQHSVPTLVDGDVTLWERYADFGLREEGALAWPQDFTL